MAMFWLVYFLDVQDVSFVHFLLLKDVENTKYKGKIMAKTLKIDMNHPGESGKTYTKNAKGATTIEITYDGTVSSDNFTKTNVSGSTLSLKLCDQWTYKLKND